MVEEQLDIVCRQLRITSQDVAAVCGCSLEDLDLAIAGSVSLNPEVRDRFNVLLEAARDLAFEELD